MAEKALRLVDGGTRVELDPTGVPFEVSCKVESDDPLHSVGAAEIIEGAAETYCSLLGKQACKPVINASLKNAKQLKAATLTCEAADCPYFVPPGQ